VTYDPNVKAALVAAGFLQKCGAYVVVDGQYGSTGKGLASGLLAEMFHKNVDLVTSNAGPNSGHTNYYEGEKIVLKQLPTFAVTAKKCGTDIQVFMNAGAVIAPETLNEEMKLHDMNGIVRVHPHATCVTDSAIGADATNVGSIGSTGKGTGPAQMAKIARKGTDAVVAGHTDKIECDVDNLYVIDNDVVMVEVSQGFSLGINSGFYPFTTSRECTVAQAISDARIPLENYRDNLMVVRSYPIRVAGNSGPTYDDQMELTWDDLGVEPEITTVTKKVRRVFTWSDDQFCDATYLNRPGVVMLNFANYLAQQGQDVDAFVRERVLQNYVNVLGRMPKAILLGFGPESKDVKVWTP
jgi:adenylosuccinate synthase